MYKKLLIFLFIGFILFLTCNKSNSQNKLEGEKSKLTNNFSINRFNKWTVDKQIKFINSLDKNSKFKFLKLFFPNNDFNSPPNEIIRFLNNGKILIFSVKQTKNFTERFSTAYWEIKSNTLRVYKKNKRVRFPVSNTEEIWTNFKVERINKYDTDIFFKFEINNEEENFAFLIYLKKGSDVFNQYKK